MKKFSDISKFLSFVLRHEPQALGIILDRQGWTDITTLITAAAKDGIRLDLATIQAVVTTNEKKRFAISDDGLRIRALQGHSTESVDIDHVKKSPPSILYHGTATHFMESIRNSGLLPGARQYVHLSVTEQTAQSVGKRHGQPVILRVKALPMHEQGFDFFQSENGVWLAREVPSKFIIF